MVSVSYAITVCNEYDEIQRLITQLLEKKQPQDEIVVLLDIGNTSGQLTEYLQKLRAENKIVLQGELFEHNFADWKNKLKSLCSKDYIFQIDADEYLSDLCFTYLHAILQSNSDVDLFLVARENTVEGITEQYIKQWGWNVDENNRINWPDSQTRLYKNSNTIEWKNKVHERITGFSKYAQLPEQLHLIHPKTIEKQIKQNKYYTTL